MAETNPFQSVITDIVGELGSFKAKAQKARPVPFGTKKVTAEEARRSLDTLTRADLEAMPMDAYQNLVRSVGHHAILEVITRDQAQSQPQPGQTPQQGFTDTLGIG